MYERVMDKVHQINVVRQVNQKNITNSTRDQHHSVFMWISEHFHIQNQSLENQFLHSTRCFQIWKQIKAP